MTEYLTAPQMAERLSPSGAAPLWIHAADENAPDGEATVPRRVAFAAADPDDDSQWFITYATPAPGCRWAVRVAAERRWAVVGPTETITRSEYDRKRQEGRAGLAQGGLYPRTIADFTAAAPDWAGEHWHIAPSKVGDVLAPVNVVPNNPK